MYCAAKIFHVNSLIAVEGMKKLYFVYPSLQTEINLSSSDNIHLSDSDNLPDLITGKLDRNLETFHNLLKNFLVDSIFCSEHLKS